MTATKWQSWHFNPYLSESIHHDFPPTAQKG